MTGSGLWDSVKPFCITKGATKWTDWWHHGQRKADSRWSRFLFDIVCMFKSTAIFTVETAERVNKLAKAARQTYAEWVAKNVRPQMAEPTEASSVGPGNRADASQPEAPKDATDVGPGNRADSGQPEVAKKKQRHQCPPGLSRRHRRTKNTSRRHRFR